MELINSEKKPIKRSQYFTAFSRDHHADLLFCWKIKEGFKRGVDPRRINLYIKCFWEEHLQDHFREEETLLFDKLDVDLTNQAKRDHLVLTEWFNRIINNKVESPTDYLSFTQLLIDHVRFEERILFPFMEEHLPKAILVSICATLNEAHFDPYYDYYADEFWLWKPDW
ncbi:MAG: hemerythrin domain-containing protein [Mucilaginibacter sp.]|nr:hemerythrin domain-containing protein [Mucilaginibacter sp.]